MPKRRRNTLAIANGTGFGPGDESCGTGRVCRDVFNGNWTLVAESWRARLAQVEKGDVLPTRATTVGGVVHALSTVPIPSI